MDNNDQRNLLDDDIIWVKISKFIVLLEPVEKWLKYLQFEDSKLSHVVEAFHEIKQHFSVNVLNSPLLQSEEKKVTEALEKRKTMAMKRIHFAAYILDPKYRGKNLTDEESNAALQYIRDLANSVCEEGVGQNSAEYVGKVFHSIAEHRSGSGFFALNFVKISTNNDNIAALDFWRGICTDNALCKLAEVIFSMPPTSAPTERSFSSQGFIHSKKRNRLTTERAGKLTYIHHNLNLQAGREKARNKTVGVGKQENVGDDDIITVEGEEAEDEEICNEEGEEGDTDTGPENEELFKEMEGMFQEQSRQ